MTDKAASWSWVWDTELKRHVILTSDGRRYSFWNKLDQNKDFPIKVHCDGGSPADMENQGWARSLEDAKRIARESAEGRPRVGLKSPGFVRARREYCRRTGKPLW